MQILEVIILAIVQALTEFLPVSSSGHLIAVQELFNIDSTIGVDVMLHFGTLIAIVIYFWKDLVQIFNDLVTKKQSNLAIAIIIGTIPAVIVGGLFNDLIEETFRSPHIVAAMLFIIGFAMIFEKSIKTDKKLDLNNLSMKQALIIGAWQCLAFLPGTSRSGITMLAGRWQGLDIVKAARFSFLLGIPVIFGATVRILLESDSRDYISNNLTAVIVGVVVSVILWWLAIAVLLKIVKKWGLAPFGWYRIVLSLLLGILLLAN